MRTEFNQVSFKNFITTIYSGQEAQIAETTENMAMNAMNAIIAMKFDLSSLAGKKIKSAKLQLVAKSEAFPWEVEFSTISNNWCEKSSNKYFDEQAKIPYANAAVWFTDSIFGVGNSISCKSSLDLVDETSVSLDAAISPEIIEKMVSGESCGIAMLISKAPVFLEIESPDGNYVDLPTFEFASSGDGAPVLVVEYEEANAAVPKEVSGLKIESVQDDFSFDKVKAIVNFDAPKVAGYPYFTVYCSEKETNIEKMERVSKYYIPNYTGKGKYSFEIKFLAPDTKMNFAVVMNNYDKASKPVIVEVETAKSQEKFAKYTESIQLTENTSLVAETDNFAIFAIDELCSTHPVYGNVFEQNMDTYNTDDGENIRKFDGGILKNGTVSYKAGIGERLGLSVVVKNKTGKPCEFSLSASSEENVSLEVGRMWYLETAGGWKSETVIPVTDDYTFCIPSTDNNIKDQTWQAAFIDVIVSPNAQAGEISGSITVNFEGSKTVIPVKIDVLPLNLENPDFKYELSGFSK